MAALNMKYSDLVKSFAAIAAADVVLGGATATGGMLLVASAALWIAPSVLLIMFTGFIVTWAFTKLIYLVVPYTLENRWTVNTWLSVLWFLPGFYIMTSLLTALLTLIFYPPYAMVQLSLSHYDNANLILAAYGDIMEAFTSGEMTFEVMRWKFLVFDANSPILMTIRFLLTAVEFLFLYVYGAYDGGKQAFMEQEEHGHKVSLKFEF